MRELDRIDAYRGNKMQEQLALSLSIIAGFRQRTLEFDHRILHVGFVIDSGTRAIGSAGIFCWLGLGVEGGSSQKICMQTYF
jgi:hypothetical protein